MDESSVEEELGRIADDLTPPEEDPSTASATALPSSSFRLKLEALLVG